MAESEAGMTERQYIRVLWRTMILVFILGIIAAGVWLWAFVRGQ